MFDVTLGSDVRQDEGFEPDAHETPRLDLLRIDPGKPMRAIVCDLEPLRVYTHWWGGRTIPCKLNDCKPCALHRKPYWHAYFTLYSPRTSQRAVVEATKACRETMATWFEAQKYWRGAELTLIRTGKEKNSRLKIAIAPGNVPAAIIPEPIDLMDFMLRLWGSAMQVQDIPRPASSEYNAIMARAEEQRQDHGLSRFSS